jgi:hypothetical protein
MTTIYIAFGFFIGFGICFLIQMYFQIDDNNYYLKQWKSSVKGWGESNKHWAEDRDKLILVHKMYTELYTILYDNHEELSDDVIKLINRHAKGCTKQLMKGNQIDTIKKWLETNTVKRESNNS